MKTQKFLLDFDEKQSLDIGLLSLSESVPHHEFFYKTNHINGFYFSRVKDILIQGEYYDYFFPRFETIHPITQNKINLISNFSSESILKKPQTELFSVESDVKYLLNHYKNLNYIIYSLDGFTDFSLLLVPENFNPSFINYNLNEEEELFNIIQFYE